MLDPKLQTLLSVVKYKNYTKAAEELSMTQPGVSHHIKMLEAEVESPIFTRSKNGMKLTPQGEIVVKYARRLQAIEMRMHQELLDSHNDQIRLRIGITHTAESNRTVEILAKCTNLYPGLNITITTDTIKNLYDMLDNFELDMAIVEGAEDHPNFSSTMLDTDYLVCVLSPTHVLANKSVITLAELKKEQMILRLPTSATRTLFESSLISHGDSIDNYNIALEVDNIATIKDLIRKNLGVSILPHSACIKEIKKKKLSAVPVENLSMVRETRIVYNNDFSHTDILQEITAVFQKEAASGI